ncbi:MAG TPA: class I SAM-dependent methyltransferase [Mycobacteriales bacterium]|nr:class I SAM-dependent methyltransferase [Mycobacteriales bacterium]
MSARASMEKRPAEVAAMFDEVAPGYDRTNALMTFGMEKRWRRQVAAQLALRSGESVLDLAAGTATSTVAFARPGVTAIGADFSLGMLRAGRARGVRLPLVAGDGLALPFASGRFDAVTISFGLRNVVDTDGCLRELARVTRPGGRLVVCEVSRPANRVLRMGHAFWMRRGMPLLARAVSSDAAAYTYLAESSLAWPEPPQLAGIITAAGWSSVTWSMLGGGAVALHSATKPA